MIKFILLDRNAKISTKQQIDFIFIKKSQIINILRINNINLILKG